MNERTAPKICVVGSINMDFAIRCRHFPRAGETLIADSLQESCGGKGANQALAAVRAGAQVQLVGCVGEDSLGDRLVGNLKRHAIGSKYLQRVAGASGVAVIAVDDSSENSILVVPGANAQLSEADILRIASQIAEFDLLVVQLECPLPAVLAALRVARAAGVPTLLDPAPAPSDWPAELLKVDWICPNEVEAGAFLGEEVASLAQAKQAAHKFFLHGARHVVVTRGDWGALYYAGDDYIEVPAHPVHALDTTAAGDAFAGALAVGIASRWSLRKTLAFAAIGGALACTKIGAQAAIASRTQIMAELPVS